MLKELSEETIVKLMEWVVKLEQENLNQLDDEDRSTIVKKIYDKLEGGINVNSMLLYSGPKEDRDEMFSLQVHTDWYGHRCYAPFSLSPPSSLMNIVACIFTGDTDFHVV